MRAARRNLALGEALRHMGVLVAADGPAPIRGLVVRVYGSALERRLIAVTRARARPFSARLAPWEASGWEHSLEPREVGSQCVLRAASVPPAHAKVAVPLCAVWVEIEGTALSHGEGLLALSVRPVGHAGAGVECETVVSVAPYERMASVCARWEGGLASRVDELVAALDAVSSVVAASSGGPCVMLARATARARVYMRPGCVVLGARGLRGDARWDAMLSAARCDEIDRMAIERPGDGPSARGVFDMSITRGTRYREGPVELVVSACGLSSGDLEGSCDALAGALRSAGPRAVCGVVHPWVPSVHDARPWESRVVSAHDAGARTPEREHADAYFIDAES